MPRTKNGPANVYLELGKILDRPQLFGLGERAPKPLVQVLTRLRQRLRNEMTKETTGSEDYLAEELSQDADCPQR